jgi:hypothetical protein
MYQYLRFFNKKGEYCNFEYDSANDRWIGRVDFQTVSDGLIEDYQIYVLEQMFDTTNNLVVMAWPHIDSSYLPGPSAPVGPSGATAASIGVTARFDPLLPVDDIFLYDFNLGPTTNILEKYYNYGFDFDYDPSQTLMGATSQYPDMKMTSVIRSEALQINVAFQPSEENGFTSHLYLQDITGKIFADIEIYGEGEEEDERLKDMLINLGIELFPRDTAIFDKSDVNEPEFDWILLNRKRKELLLEYANIFPYMGSYKALINVIKFFGYQNVRMKEYWRNIDARSPNFGKYLKTDIKDLFTENANFNNVKLVPSKIYKKTSLFGLYYDITVESGEYDEDGIPIVEEVFEFSPQEVLIKIFALKKKLKDYFLPLNARIIDIVGEAVFYGKYDINIWNEQSRIDAISLGLKPKFSVLPSNKGCIRDLRYLSYFGCPIGPDLNLNGETNILSWRIGYGSTSQVGGILDGIQTFYLDMRIPGPTSHFVTATFARNPNTGQTAYSPVEIVNGLVSAVNSFGPPISNNFIAYQEGGSSGILRIIQTNGVGNGTIYVGATSNTAPVITAGIAGGVFLPGPTSMSGPSLGVTGGTATSINISSGPSGTFGPSGAPMSYYADCFLGYFDRTNIAIPNLNDDEDIPVGSPAVLRNDTFNITWDEANVTFDQLDQPNITLIGTTASTLYSPFTLSNTITGWTATYPRPDLPIGATYISIPVGASVTGFPYSGFPSQNVYTWENLGYYGYYEMQWIVRKESNETPNFFADSGRLPISQINQFPVVFPYSGKYQVELYLWDGYNNKSSLITRDSVDICIPDIDFIGWYQYRERNYTWDTKRYPVQKDYAKWPIENGPAPGPNLTWDEYSSTWDLPFHPNEAMSMAEISYNSLDSIEFYQNQVNPVASPLVDRSPYYYNLIGNSAKWNDVYHLWWDGTGTKITQWEIRGLTGSTASIYMTRGNTILDLNSINLYYEQGPTGYTGATGATSLIGSTGDVIISESNRRTYQFDGIEWKYIIDVVDSYVSTGLSGTDKAKFLELTRQLNEALPNDGLQHPYLTDFIYYYNEEYDNLYALNPYIRAVSKNFDRGGRHIISMSGATGDTQSYETVYFGYLGDIPTHFEMYQVSSTGPAGSILISGMTAPYSIGSTNLIDLESELNGPTAQSTYGIKNYTFNLVLGASGWSGGSGPISGITEIKLQGTSKAFTNPDLIDVQFTGGIIGTSFGRSLIKNPDWDGIRILKYSQELPLLTVVNFTYDPAKMWGKKNPTWILKKENDSSFQDIYDENRYFSYLFTQRGSYTLSLTLEDTNGNIQTITKPEIIKIV